MPPSIANANARASSTRSPSEPRSSGEPDAPPLGELPAKPGEGAARQGDERRPDAAGARDGALHREHARGKPGEEQRHEDHAALNETLTKLRENCAVANAKRAANG